MTSTSLNTYVLGAKPRIKITTVDVDGITFIPSEIRLSIKEPSETIITYSGGELLAGSGYMYTYYSPPLVGWYQYEAWVKDGNGLETAETRGFEVIDLVYPD